MSPIRAYQNLHIPLDEAIPPQFKETMIKVSKKYLRSSAAQKHFLNEEFRICFEKDFMLNDEGDGNGGGDRPETPTEAPYIGKKARQ